MPGTGYPEETRRRALLVGGDLPLQEALTEALEPLFSLATEASPPALWPDDLDLILIAAAADATTTLEYLTRAVAATGTAPFVLLRERDPDLILKATRAGARGFIEVPDDIANLLSLLQMEERRRRGQGGMVSVFFSLKGGVGSTTLAVNAAHHLNAMTDGRTVLLDLNLPLGDTAFYLNIHQERTYSISDFIHNLERFDERLIRDSLTRHESGLYLLSLPKHFEDLDNLTPATIRAALRTLRLYFDHVVIDGSSDLNPVMLSCLDDADTIALIADPSLVALRAAQAVCDLGQRLGYPEEKVKLILNRDNAAGEELIGVVVKKLALPVAGRVANDYLLFLETSNEGVLLHDHRPDCLADRQIRALARMLHHRLPAAEPEPQAAEQNRRWAGVFGRRAAAGIR